LPIIKQNALEPYVILYVLRQIFSYSAYQFLFNIINYFSRNLDKLLIGKYMGMSPLGYYEKSYRLMMLPLQNITQVITPVMHPIFSDYQNDLERLASGYERIVRFLAFIGLPLSVLLYFTASEVTLIIFGDQWIPSIPIFQILTLSVGIQIILSSSGSIFQAAGDTKSLFVCGLFSSASHHQFGTNELLETGEYAIDYMLITPKNHKNKM
jgi:O-antigen/teichoic acid export membrane protein